MKKILSTITFCLIAAVSFAQLAKHSSEELVFTPQDKIVRVTIYSQGIIEDGMHAYSVSTSIDVPNQKFLNVVLKRQGESTVIALNKVTYIKNLYLPGLGTYGEAYAYKGSGTNMIFYFMKGNSSALDFKVMFYLPAGPQNLQTAN